MTARGERGADCTARGLGRRVVTDGWRSLNSAICGALAKRAFGEGFSKSALWLGLEATGNGTDSRARHADGALDAFDDRLNSCGTLLDGAAACRDLPTARVRPTKWRAEAATVPARVR